MKLARNGEAGQALILVLLLLALGPLLVVPMLRLSYSSQRYHQIADINTLNTYAADSGVQYALCKFRNDPARDDFTDNFTLNDRTVTVTAEDIGNNLHRITATATSPNGRSTTIESYFFTLSIFHEYVATGGEGGVEILNSYIDSSPVDHEADIHSNGDINMSENSDVDGYITYLGDFTDSGGGYIDETQVEEAEMLPPIDTEFWKAQAQAGGTRNGDLTLDDREDYTLGPIYITGNLLIRDCEDMRLNGTVYVEGNITIEDESEINRGSGALIAVGDVDIKQECRVGTSSSLFLIMSVNGLIKGQGSGDEDPVRIYGLLYAPNSIVELQNVRLRGSAVGNKVKLQDTYATYITEVEEDRDLPGNEVVVITYGYGP